VEALDAGGVEDVSDGYRTAEEQEQDTVEQVAVSTEQHADVVLAAERALRAGQPQEALRLLAASDAAATSTSTAASTTARIVVQARAQAALGELRCYFGLQTGWGSGLPGA
jgi:hypothetical protein